jgi:hypothetical protein
MPTRRRWLPPRTTCVSSWSGTLLRRHCEVWAGSTPTPPTPSGAPGSPPWLLSRPSAAAPSCSARRSTASAPSLTCSPPTARRSPRWPNVSNGRVPGPVYSLASPVLRVSPCPVLFLTSERGGHCLARPCQEQPSGTRATRRDRSSPGDATGSIGEVHRVAQLPGVLPAAASTHERVRAEWCMPSHRPHRPYRVCMLLGHGWQLQRRSYLGLSGPVLVLRAGERSFCGRRSEVVAVVLRVRPRFCPGIEGPGHSLIPHASASSSRV